MANTVAMDCTRADLLHMLVSVQLAETTESARVLSIQSICQDTQKSFIMRG